MVDTVRGVLRVRKWPSRTGDQATGHLTEYKDVIRAVNWLWRYLPGDLKRQYMAAAKPPQLQARDIFVAAMLGALVHVTDDEGNTYYPMSALDTISKTLDVLSVIPGSLIARDLDYWRSLPPGNPGQILTSQGRSGQPVWADPVLPSAQPYIYSAGQLEAQGSLCLTSRLANGVVSLRLHHTADNYAALNIQRPAGMTKAVMSIEMLFPTTVSGNVVLWYELGGYNNTSLPVSPTVQYKVVGSIAAGIPKWYSSDPFTLPLDATVITLLWGRKGTHAQDTYGDFTYMTLVKIEWE